MHYLFGRYVIEFPTYTLVYGAFAAVPIFLAWLYLSWTVILGGALVTAELPRAGRAGDS
jgi:membrane protein